MMSPQAQQIQAFMKSAVTSTVQLGIPIEIRRAEYEALRARIPLPSDVQVEPVTIGSVAAEWVCAPESEEQRVLLYVHGGGYVMGSCASYRVVAATFSRVVQARVLVLDYRLAPEHPFPAALEDSIATYRWGLSCDVQPGQMIMVGDSAGGGLVLATLVELSQAGLPLPAGAVLISPWLDMTASAASYTTKAEVDFIDSRELILEMRQQYLGERDPKTPLASPLFADVTGLPPVLIYAGSDEILLDDSLKGAEHLRQAGVSVELQIGEGFWHTWPITAAMRPFPEGTAALEHIGEFVRLQCEK